MATYASAVGSRFPAGGVADQVACRGDQVVDDRSVLLGDLRDGKRPGADLKAQGGKLPAGCVQPTCHVHAPGPARGVTLGPAQCLARVPLRRGERRRGLRAGPQAQQHGRGALCRELGRGLGRRGG
jgi:hypothetical protein